MPDLPDLAGYEAAHPACPGCGVRFKGPRGLRAHQSRPYITLACRPLPAPAPALPDPPK